MTFDPVNNNQYGKAYWGASPVSYYYSDGQTHFEYQDWQGTERMRTYWDGSLEATYQSLPWGDGFNASGADDDPYHFAGLDQDASSLDHAQFREYSNMAGRWMSPDPYGGSYDPTNPQSFNRYAYVLNKPLSFTDPAGLKRWVGAGGGYTDCGNDPSCSSSDSGNGDLWGGGGDTGASNGLLGGNDVVYCGSLCSLVGTYQWGVFDDGKLGQLFILEAGPGGLYWAYASGDPDMIGEEADSGTMIEENLIIPNVLPPFTMAANAQNNEYTYGKTFSFKDLAKGVWGCIKNVGLPAMANDLNPGSDAAYSAGFSALSVGYYNGALAHAAGRGLTTPLRSSTYRGLMRQSAGAAEAAPIAILDQSLLAGVIAEVKGCL